MFVYPWLMLLSAFMPVGQAGSFDNGIAMTGDTVTAETQFTAAIVDEQYYDPSYSGLDIAKIEVYLAASASTNAASMGGNSFDSQCTLHSNISLCSNGISIFNNHIDFNKSSFTVSIPKDVGPPGRFYSLHAQMYLTNGRRYSGEISSPPFTLSGAMGSFGTVQQKGYTLWSATYFPCSSFSCVVACADAATARGTSSDTNQYHDCAAKCPGVTLPPADSPDLDSGVPPVLPTAAPACLLSTIPSFTSSGSRSATSSSPHLSSAITSLSNTGQRLERGTSVTAAVLLFLMSMGF